MRWERQLQWIFAVTSLLCLALAAAQLLWVRGPDSRNATVLAAGFFAAAILAFPWEVFGRARASDTDELPPKTS